MSLKTMLEKLVGHKIRRVPMRVSTEADHWAPGVDTLARTTRAMLRDPVKLEPGEPLVGIALEDVDPDTGKVYPDFMERRRLREEARKGTGKGIYAGTVNRSVDPD